MFGSLFPALAARIRVKGIFFNLDDEMPELEGVALPFLTKQTFPEWPLPPLKRQDFTHQKPNGQTQPKQNFLAQNISWDICLEFRVLT